MIRFFYASILFGMRQKMKIEESLTSYKQTEKNEWDYVN